MSIVKCMDCYEYAQVEKGECPHCGSNQVRNIEMDMELVYE